MTLTANGLRDVGRLVQYALRPRTRVGTDSEYGDLVKRYTDDAEFRTAVDCVTDGLDLTVLHAGGLGLVLNSRRESVFAYRISDETGTWTKDQAKLLRGLAHLGIAAYAFPHPDDLRDPTVRYVDVLAVDEFIHRCCTELSERATRADREGEYEAADGAHRHGAGHSGDAVVDLARSIGLEAAWTQWSRMHSAQVGRTGRGAGRIASASSTYWVLRALKELSEQGMARQAGRDSDGRYQILDRFRHHVGAAAGQEGYRALAALRQGEATAQDARVPGALRPLPGRLPAWAETAESVSDASATSVTSLRASEPETRDLADMHSPARIGSDASASFTSGPASEPTGGATSDPDGAP
jgi:hypothetical protein